MGLRAARELHEQDMEVDMLNLVGWLQHLYGKGGERALSTLSSSIDLAQEIGYHRGIMVANCTTGLVLLALGRGEEGLEHSRLAYEMSTVYDFFDLQFWMAIPLGTVLLAVGRFEESLDLHRALLAEVRSRSDETNQDMAAKAKTVVLTFLGDCLSGLARWAEAAQSYHDARSPTGEAQAGFRTEAELALQEGIAWRNAGVPERARACLLHAHDLLDGPAHRAERERAESELALVAV
jgi:hypothetical protein